MDRDLSGMSGQSLDAKPGPRDSRVPGLRTGTTLRALAALAAGLAVATPGNAFNLPQSFVVHEMTNTRIARTVMLDAAERAAVEAGSAGPGWHFTGQTWRVFDQVGNLSPVCRFYSASSNSHFFTADAAECEYLRRPGSGWDYEKIAFRARPWEYGACRRGYVTTDPYPRPVFRLYNNRWMFGDSNHRFTPDTAERDRLVAEGWILEGVAFCVDDVATVPVHSFTASTGNLGALAPCTEADSPAGACYWLRNLPAMSRWLLLAPYLPPDYVRANPDYQFVEAFRNRTGCMTAGDGHFRTAQEGNDLGHIATRSFLQEPCGYFINSLDRVAGGLVGMGPRYKLDVATPAAGAPDRRVLPWGDSLERDVVISFALAVNTTSHRSEGAQLYGLPVLTFQDLASGKRVLIAIETYGTSPPQDLVVRDVASDDIIVATVFRGDPAFGKRLAGDYVLLCRALQGCGRAFGGDFRFSIDSSGFRKVLAAARAADPGLSPRPEDYLLASFEFRNEVSGDGELGLSLNAFRLEVHPPRAPGN